MKKPKPIQTTAICSICGLDWDRHGEEPTAEKCIELLQADLAAEKRRIAPIQPLLPQPYPVPYPLPYPRPYTPLPWTQPRPYWTTIGTGGTYSPPQSPYRVINTTGAVTH